jgi:ribonuclease HI
LLVINIDGASRGNPGLSGIGILIMKDNLKIDEHKEFIGEKTNNQTEYIALKKALQMASSINHDCAEITILSDSELVVNQRNKRYRVRNKQLKIILREITNLEKKFKNVIYRHIPREKNILADLLANQAIDEHIKYQKRYSKRKWQR